MTYSDRPVPGTPVVPCRRSECGINIYTLKHKVKSESEQLRNKHTSRSLSFSILLGGCPFNGPLSGTKYPTRAASPIQNASTPKSVTVFKTSQLCAVVRCCAQVLVEHCTEFRTSFISN